MKRTALLIFSLLFVFVLAVSSEAADVTWENAMDYYYGSNGKQRDYKAALTWFKKRGDYAGPNFYIAEIYQFGGYGVDKNEKEANKYYKKALAQNKSYAENYGDPSCMYRVGYMYQRGLGTEINHEEAVKWLKKGTEKVHLGAMYRLAIAYRDGLGVEQDYKEALRLYKSAASKGHWSSMNAIGNMYRRGEGVEKDILQAINWYEKAAEAGDVFAKYYLGKIYEEGDGVSVDINKAKEWYTKAAQSGNADAKKALERLGN